MHSGGFELTKLTYTRLRDNLIRHRGEWLEIKDIHERGSFVSSCLIAFFCIRRLFISLSRSPVIFTIMLVYYSTVFWCWILKYCYVVSLGCILLLIVPGTLTIRLLSSVHLRLFGFAFYDHMRFISIQDEEPGWTLGFLLMTLGRQTDWQHSYMYAPLLSTRRAIEADFLLVATLHLERWESKTSKCKYLVSSFSNRLLFFYHEPFAFSIFCLTRVCLSLPPNLRPDDNCLIVCWYAYENSTEQQ